MDPRDGVISESRWNMSKKKQKKVKGQTCNLFTFLWENLRVQTVYHKPCVAKISSQLKKDKFAISKLTEWREPTPGGGYSVNVCEEWVLGLTALSHCPSNLKGDGANITNLVNHPGGELRTLNFHPGGSEPEWVQSYYYAPGKYSHAPLKIQLKPNWAPVSTANVPVN